MQSVSVSIFELEKCFDDDIFLGTAQNPDGEIAYCDIEIHLFHDDLDHVEWLTGLLNRIGIPKGSVLQGIGPEIEVGTLEGIGRMYSYWEGSTYTALYFYGLSFSKMKESVETFIAQYPLCQKCRIEQIA